MSSLVEIEYSTIQTFKVGSEHNGKDNKGQDPNPMEMGVYFYFVSFF